MIRKTQCNKTCDTPIEVRKSTGSLIVFDSHHLAYGLGRECRIGAFGSAFLFFGRRLCIGYERAVFTVESSKITVNKALAGKQEVMYIVVHYQADLELR